MSAPLGHAAITALAKELRRPASSLFALASRNDPFYVGTPAQIQQAEWFADLWTLYGFGTGTHTRRIHYRLISQEEPPKRVDGRSPYLNTLAAWKELQAASKAARYLGLVDRDDFIDRRNPPPRLHATSGQPGKVELRGCYLFDLDLPDELDTPTLDLSPPQVAQRYLIEIWVEKSTIDEELLPICRRYGVNLVTFIGEASLSACRDLVHRARADGRPVRVLYISDFDPGGASMPVAAARKVEWCLAAAGGGLDIQFRPILLTQEQCITYKLPRTPIKVSEKRAAQFEKRFGEGATELDALVALHSGELERIVRKELDRYFDPDLRQAEAIVAREARAELARIEAAVLTSYAEDVEEIRARYARLVAEAEAIRADAEPLWQAITDSLAEAQPNVDDFAWPEPAVGDEDPAPLFDSRRGYVEQVGFYKLHQGKPTGRRPRGTGTKSKKRGNGRADE